MFTVLTVLGALFLIVLTVYVFLIMPRTADRADMELSATDYAHRGLWSTPAPENSLAAFARAKEAGYGIELDLRLSRDGHVMVFHDDSLLRMCGCKARVEDLTLRELKSLRLAGTSETIPTLSEVLSLIDGSVPLLLEIKGKGREDRLCMRVARLLDRYGGVFAIESFNPLILSYFKHYRPLFARGQLVTKISASEKKERTLRFVLFHMLANVLSRPDFIAIHGKYRKNLSFLICTRIFRAPAFIWTVRNEKEYRLCKKAGQYAIFEGICPVTQRKKESKNEPEFF